ncbi:hypothetical protein NYF14_02660 [Sphingobium sp. 10 DY56-G10]
MDREKCPFGPPQISLSHDDLAAIGQIAMLEARAKASTLAALKGLARLSSDEWEDYHNQQFKQITIKLIAAAEKVDADLHSKALRLERLRGISQDDRHKIVHAGWGQSPDGKPAAYDVKRKSWLSRAEIQRAITSNEQTDRLAFVCLWDTAKLVEEGIIPQRTVGAGPAMRLNSGLWKW